MFAILRQRDFGLLWLSGLVSYIGDFALIIALPLHVYRLTDSTLATAGVMAANFVPRVLLGSVAGVFVDRWDRKRVMVVADLLRALVLLALVVAPDRLGVLYAVAAALGGIGLFFGPAEGALLPKLVGEDQLVPANAMNALNDNLGMLLGPALGALLYARVGIGGVALVNAITYVVSAALIALIRADGRAVRNEPVPGDEQLAGGAAWRRMLGEWRAGLGVVRGNRALRVLFGAWSCACVSDGIFVTLGLAPLVLDVLGGTAAQVGWVASAQAVGGMAASLLVVRYGQRLSKRWLLGGGMIGIGLADFATANTRRIVAGGTPAVAVAMGWMVLAGPPGVASGAGRQSIVQEQTVDAYRGRVFGAFGSLASVALLAGVLIGGLLGDWVGLVPVLSAGALLRVAGGIGAVLLMPRDAEARDPAGLGEAALAEREPTGTS